MFSLDPRRVSAALLLAAGLFGCTTSSEDYPTVPANYGYDTVLVSVGANVIYPTYVDLAAKGAALEAAVTALDANPNQTTLTAARQAWREARAPWESSEGFLFGPVDAKGVDPSIDSWPLDSIALKGALADSSIALSVSYIDAQRDELKGFHAIEYLLFGVDSSKTAAALTARERQYLKAAAAHFKSRVDTLKNSWDPAKGNFLGDFQNAGTTSTVYLSRRAAAEELIQGMFDICDEVANGKITDPLNDGVSKEESRFSRNSTTDFANNIRSVRNVYLGVYGTNSGKGVKAWVQAADSALAIRVEVELDSAISKILQMGEFSTALSTGRPKVTAARSAVQTVMKTIDGRVRHAVLP